jgi:hypothetical protein
MPTPTRYSGDRRSGSDVRRWCLAACSVLTVAVAGMAQAQSLGVQSAERGEEDGHHAYSRAPKSPLVGEPEPPPRAPSAAFESRLTPVISCTGTRNQSAS